MMLSRHAAMMLALVVTTSVGAGCGSSMKQSEDVMTAVRTYGDGLRWQRHAMAASKLPPAERSDFLLERDVLAEDLRINGYDVVSVEGGKDRNRTIIVLKYTWYGDREGIVRDTYARQEWERHGKVWILIKEEHLRGESMPGLAEPPATDADTTGDATDDAGGVAPAGDGATEPGAVAPNDDDNDAVPPGLGEP